MLKPELCSLPSLQGIKLRVFTPLPSLKTGRGEDVVYGLSGMLPDFKALTSLAIHDGHDRWFTTTSPLVLPRLVEFHLTTRRDASFNIFRHLVAPLTRLQVEGSNYLGDVPSVQRLCSGLQRFVQLRRLSIELDIYRCRRDHTAVEQAMRADVTAALGCLSHLQELNLQAPFFLSLPIMQQLAAHATGLHCLLLRCKCRAGGDDSARETWGQLVSHISRFSLKRLDLRPGHVPVAPGVAALGSQEQLTALHVNGWECCLATAADCSALAQLTQLRSAFIEKFTHSDAGHTYAVCVHLLGALPALT